MAHPVGWPISDGLQRAWKESGLTQAEIAERINAKTGLGLTQPTISEYVRGIQRLPMHWLLWLDEVVFEQPRGHVLRLSGLVEDGPNTTVAALRSDPELDDDARRTLLDFYDFVRKRLVSSAK